MYRLNVNFFDKDRVQRILFEGVFTRTGGLPNFFDGLDKVSAKECA